MFKISEPVGDYDKLLRLKRRSPNVFLDYYLSFGEQNKIISAVCEEEKITDLDKIHLIKTNCILGDAPCSKKEVVDMIKYAPKINFNDIDSDRFKILGGEKRGRKKGNVPFTFAKYCKGKGCGKLFHPSGKYTYFCDECSKEIERKRVEKLKKIGRQRSQAIKLKKMTLLKNDNTKPKHL
jgi:hypothetical protein